MIPPIVMLVVQASALLLCAWVMAQVTRRLRLAPLLGMIIGGFLASTFVLPHLPGSPPFDLALISPVARLVVLSLILLRAGLGLSASDYRQASGLTLRLGLIPRVGDAALVALGGVILLDLPWLAAAVLGFLVAPISPAIVIPGMITALDQRVDGDRRVPAALLAGAPLDNIVAVMALGVALDLALARESHLTMHLLLVVHHVLTGALIGALAGALIGLPLRRARDAGGPGTLAVWLIGALLFPLCKAVSASAVVAALVMGGAIRAVARDQVPALTAGLTGAWAPAQVVLFGLIGAAVSPTSLQDAGLAALIVILMGQLGRAAGALLASAGSQLGPRERAACILCYLPKATIQAAFAGLALDRGLPGGEILLSTAVLAIVVLAPLGTATLQWSADHLLPGGQLKD